MTLPQADQIMRAHALLSDILRCSYAIPRAVRFRENVQESLSELNDWLSRMQELTKDLEQGFPDLSTLSLTGVREMSDTEATLHRLVAEYCENYVRKDDDSEL